MPNTQTSLSEKNKREAATKIKMPVLRDCVAMTIGSNAVQTVQEGGQIKNQSSQGSAEGLKAVFSRFEVGNCIAEAIAVLLGMNLLLKPVTENVRVKDSLHDRAFAQYCSRHQILQVGVGRKGPR